MTRLIQQRDAAGMVLLGNLSLRTGKKIEWDAKQMRATKTNSEFFDMMRRFYGVMAPMGVEYYGQL